VSKFVVPMWTARGPDVRHALHAASIPVAGDSSSGRRELKAIVEAESPEDAVTKVRQVVGRNAAVPAAASPTAD
jgi:hypothetical protein